MAKYFYLYLCLLFSGCTNQQVNLHDCQDLADKQETTEADICYRSYINYNQKDVSAYFKYIDFLREEGKPSKAEEILKKIKIISPTASNLDITFGKVYLDLGYTKQAKNIFKKIVKSDMSNHVALNGLAVCFDIEKRHAEAQENYKKALEHSPENSTYLINLGLSLIMSKDYKKAIHYLEPLDHLEQAQHNLAIAYAALGRDKDFRNLLKSSFTAEEQKKLYKHLKSLVQGSHYD